jgi:hypothetical protein
VVWVTLVETADLPAGMGVRFLRIQPYDLPRRQRFLRTID